MSEPLDLDAVEDELAGAGCLRPRTAAALLAEVQRLRAENERHQKANLVRTVVRYAEGRDLQMCPWCGATLPDAEAYPHAEEHLAAEEWAPREFKHGHDADDQGPGLVRDAL